VAVVMMMMMMWWRAAMLIITALGSRWDVTAPGRLIWYQFRRIMSGACYFVCVRLCQNV